MQAPLPFDGDNTMRGQANLFINILDVISHFMPKDILRRVEYLLTDRLICSEDHHYLTQM